MNTTMEKPNTTTVARMEPTRCGCCYRPNVDIAEDATTLTVYADMPGVQGDTIDVDFENGLLTIRGTVAQRQTEGTRFVHREYGVGDFHRSFEVGESIDATRISASYSNGVLTLTLPKVEAARPRKIVVQVK
jgi:HSP20 family protein